MSGRARLATPAGLPGPLPAGEAVLWQGSPSWRALARRAFHVRKVAAYCAVLLAWRGAADLYDGVPPAEAAAAVLGLAPIALAAVGAFALLALLYVRTTVYTVTSRRVVMRFGVALPVTLNIPFRAVAAAGLKAHADGTGDIPLALNGDGRMAYIHLWPFARPWRVARPEPMLRAVPDAARVAEVLARALAAAAPRPAPPAAAAAAPAGPPPLGKAA